ncbi:hypothetical protein NDU88_011480 [Pleurodeles waltl]|uniref:Uncharacterized protein n=1 Tax=Pleurodeles waltl TaxID=8319 RepID=A0AAV7R1S5_PLEWA|nr:hypothetical protein NDU88_011480 [Pleurodeles waltl]
MDTGGVASEPRWQTQTDLAQRPIPVYLAIRQQEGPMSAMYLCPPELDPQCGDGFDRGSGGRRDRCVSGIIACGTDGSGLPGKGVEGGPR